MSTSPVTGTIKGSCTNNPSSLILYLLTEFLIACAVQETTPTLQGLVPSTLKYQYKKFLSAQVKSVWNKKQKQTKKQNKTKTEHFHCLWLNFDLVGAMLQTGVFARCFKISLAQ